MRNQDSAVTVLDPPVPAQADSDAQLVEIWLHGRARRTVRAYRAGAQAFMAHADKPLQAITVGDVQAFAGSLDHLAPASQAAQLSAVKSLLAYAHRLGYLPFDVGKPVKLPPIKSTLAERIISEADVHQLLAHERRPRNKMLLLLIYAAGLRVSEACGLAWRDVVGRQDGGQITIFGKGGKTRTILLPASVYDQLEAMRSGDDDPVFRSLQGGHLDPAQVHRIVKAAARRADLPAAISTHWLRHAHASHSLDRGAAIHLVQATLGHASVATTGRYLHARPNDSSARYLPV